MIDEPENIFSEKIGPVYFPIVSNNYDSFLDAISDLPLPGASKLNMVNLYRYYAELKKLKTNDRGYEYRISIRDNTAFREKDGKFYVRKSINYPNNTTFSEINISRLRELPTPARVENSMRKSPRANARSVRSLSPQRKQIS